MIVRTALQSPAGLNQVTRASSIVTLLYHDGTRGILACRPVARLGRRAFASSTLAADDSPSSARPPSAESSSTSPSNSTSSAAYLLEQALREEAEEDRILQARLRARKPKELQEEAWDGDEPQHRAIRRILEDQYKPLRVKGHVKKIPVPAPLPASLFADRPSTPPLPSDSSTSSALKEPWQVKFKPPDHYQPLDPSRVASSSLPPPISGAPSSALRSKGMKRHQRVAEAYERSLDYGAGFRAGGVGERVMVPDEREGEGEGGKRDGRRAMGGMRAWDGIVEDKIQQAQRDGLFKKVRGRGKPMLRDVEAESNPYIKRDDFLINRVIKQQGVAPPWIELQRELELAVAAFRHSIREAWIRRATRMQSIGGVTRGAIREIEEGWRDKEWEAQELSYHTTAINSINATVRRYNVVAPYSARRGLHSVQAEVNACVKNCIPAIAWELQRRLDGGRVVDLPDKLLGGKDEGADEKVVEVGVADDRFWPALRRGVFDVLGIKVEERK